ncbi:MAG: hypothetical protein EB119_08750 [Synechococcaceae bacterium WBB_34_004]|nr:hypothetical protein [Synechococcaceae bacterium WBB_34_004]
MFLKNLEISEDEMTFFKLMLDSDAVEPLLLFPLTLGPKARILNVMLYDHFHGNGWKLNLLTGRYERDAATQS